VAEREEASVKRFRVVVLAMVVCGLVAGCGGTAKTPTLEAKGVSRRQPAADAPVDTVATALTGLGYSLDARALPAGKNTVVSPLSIAYAFAMLRAGAGGQTAAQLDRVFGFPATGRDDAFNAITRQVATADIPPAKTDKRTDATPRPPVVALGNALFPAQDQPIGAPYLRTLAAQYGAGVHPVDFASGKATGVINQWVTRQTAGRITKLFDKLSGDTRLVLANTVYLRADWPAQMFSGSGVSQDPFTRASGGPVTVPMMHAENTLRYGTGNGYQAVEIPYADSGLAMLILLPSTGGSPTNLLAPAMMSAAVAALHDQDLDLALPRFDFATDLDLVPALHALGLTAPFTSSADFTAISPGLYVDQAVHRANITVDEWGTEAAAVTGIGMAAAARVPPDTRMAVDHPFAFAIIHTGTGVPLFMGTVADPSVH
jgi:serpin B